MSMASILARLERIERKLNLDRTMSVPRNAPVFVGAGIVIDSQNIRNTRYEPPRSHRQAAYEYAKQRASEYDSHRFNEDAERSYWWGRNAGDRATHRFVIEPAPA
jgi:hypothetical protein